jgi:hypothetical protein
MKAMQRHDRTRFIAFGILPLLNIVALLLYGLDLSTRGRGGAAASLPLLLGLAAGLVVVVLWAVIKRGHDRDWAAWRSLATCVGGIMFGPAVLLVAGYLAWVPSPAEPNHFGPPPPPAGLATWLAGGVVLVSPWAVLAVAAQLL